MGKNSAISVTVLQKAYTAAKTHFMVQDFEGSSAILQRSLHKMAILPRSSEKLAAARYQFLFLRGRNQIELGNYHAALQSLSEALDLPKSTDIIFAIDPHYSAIQRLLLQVFIPPADAQDQILIQQLTWLGQYLNCLDRIRASSSAPNWLTLVDSLRDLSQTTPELTMMLQFFQENGAEICKYLGTALKSWVQTKNKPANPAEMPAKGNLLLGQNTTGRKGK